MANAVPTVEQCSIGIELGRMEGIEETHEVVEFL